MTLSETIFNEKTRISVDTLPLRKTVERAVAIPNATTITSNRTPTHRFVMLYTKVELVDFSTALLNLS